MERIAMSQEERDDLHWLKRVEAGSMTQREAAEKMGVTARWSWGRFVESDATPQNMGVLWEYLEKNGRMVDVYTDRASMFTVTPRAGESKEQRAQGRPVDAIGTRTTGVGDRPHSGVLAAGSRKFLLPGSVADPHGMFAQPCWGRASCGCP